MSIKNPAELNRVTSVRGILEWFEYWKVRILLARLLQKKKPG